MALAMANSHPQHLEQVVSQTKCEVSVKIPHMDGGIIWVVIVIVWKLLVMWGFYVARWVHLALDRISNCFRVQRYKASVGRR